MVTTKLILNNFLDWSSPLLEIFLNVGGGRVDTCTISKETTTFSGEQCFLGYWWKQRSDHPEEIAAWKRCKLNPAKCCSALLAQKIVP